MQPLIRVSIKGTVFLKGLLCAISALIVAQSAQAQVDGYPLIDNESIGLVRALGQAVEGPPDVYDEVQWSRALIEQMDAAGVMSPFRYLIAFSAYAVAHASLHTPAYREPYGAIYRGYLRKMEQPEAWEDYVIVWGGESPLHENIMYTGHLAYMMTIDQQLYGANPAEFVLTATDGRQWTGDYMSLMASLADQAANGVDADGEPTWGIACEPGQVFVPCNTPHRVAELLFDELHGTERNDTLPEWLEWVDTEMLDAEHQVLHDLYLPFGDVNDDTARRTSRLSGTYNGWTLWFLLALDEDKARELYANYVDYFVLRGPDSTYGDGRTVVIDQHGGDDLFAWVMDLISTGFGMATAQAFGDEALVTELQESWDLAMGPAEWQEEHAVWTHTAVMLPRVFQNSFDLLSRTIDPADPMGLASAPWDGLSPHLSRVSNDAVFVNQAVYDAEQDKLILTVNGGRAVSEPVVLSVAQLDPSGDWQVLRNGAPHSKWSFDGGLLEITTPALSPEMESYVVLRGAPRAGDSAASSCGCAGAPSSAGWWVLLVGFLAVRQRGGRGRRWSRHVIHCLRRDVAQRAARRSRTGSSRPSRVPWR